MFLNVRLVCVVVCVCLHTRTHAAAVPAVRSLAPQKDVLLTHLLRALELYNMKEDTPKDLNSWARHPDNDALKSSPYKLPDTRTIEDMAVLVYLSSSGATNSQEKAEPKVRIEYVPKELVFGDAKNSSGNLYPVQYFAVRKIKTKKEGDLVRQFLSEGKESPLNRNKHLVEPAHPREPLTRRSKRGLWSSHKPTLGHVPSEKPVHSPKQPSRNLPIRHRRRRGVSTSKEASDLLVMQEQRQEGAISRQFGPLAGVGSGLLPPLQAILSNTGVVVSVIILCVSYLLP